MHRKPLSSCNAINVGEVFKIGNWFTITKSIVASRARIADLHASAWTAGKNAMVLLVYGLKVAISSLYV